MPKKIKTESADNTAAGAPVTNPEPSEVPVPATEAKAPAAKKTPPKKAGKSVAKKASSKKAAAPRKATTRKASGAAKLIKPSDDEIRLRAYFIAERRTRHGHGGDSAHDWLQARQELLAELNPGRARR